MKLNYNLDIDERSENIGHTPGEQSHGLPFCVLRCGHMYAESNYFTEREGLAEYLLIYTISGCGSMYYRGKEHKIPANHAVLINCYEYQLYKTDCDGVWNFKWAHIGGVCAEEYFQILNDDTLSVVNMEGVSGMEEKFDEIIRAIKIGGGTMVDIKLCLIVTSMLSEIILSRQGALNNKKYYLHKAEIDNVLSFIHKNFREYLCIDDIMSTVHMSKYYFIRIFKAYIGMSPYEYLVNYRINKSKELLIETDLDVEAVACAVGFGDINNFIRSFKRRTGITPLKYRRFSPR